MRRTPAILATALLPLMLVLAGCSSDGGGSSASSSAPASSSASAGDTHALDSLKLTSEGEKKVPGLSFDKPLAASSATAKVIKEGTGSEVKAGQSVSYVGAVVSGADGKVGRETFTSQSLESLVLNDDVKTQNEVLYNAMVGAKVGTYIAFATAAQAATPSATASSSASGGASASATPTASDIVVLKLVSAKDLPTRAQGTAVPPKAGLPTVKLDGKGAPTITVPKTKAPTSLVSQNLIVGNGKKVTASSQVTVQYTGVKWSNGQVFDSSWTKGSPTTFPLNQVVKGWSQGLTGKTVGSQVLLVIPPSLGYGDQQGSELQKETLVFVVDILDAT